MKYTDKQIGKILNVQEFVAMSNTLSKVYLDFENKEYFIDTFTDRDRIYRIYCASIYNLITFDVVAFPGMERARLHLVPYLKASMKKPNFL